MVINSKIIDNTRTMRERETCTHTVAHTHTHARTHTHMHTQVKNLRQRHATKNGVVHCLR